MIITLSPAFMENRAFPENHIREIARQVGCHFQPKWANERSTRGVLVKAQGSYQAATDDEHDSFIAGIFKLDPEAYVRTALGTYNGEWEWTRQFAIHHINGDPRDNTPANLRLVKIQERNRKQAKT